MNQKRFACLPAAVGLALLLAGCSSTPRIDSAAIPDLSAAGPSQDKASEIGQESELRRKAMVALSVGDHRHVTASAAELVALNPRSSRAHLLLAAGYHLAGDPTSLELASSGYEAARQFAGSDLWPSYLAGATALQKRSPELAMELFAASVLTDPDNAFAFEGLAAASYAAGHPGLAQAAASRARELMPDSEVAWRMETLAAAALGDREAVEALLRHTPRSVGKHQQEWVTGRSRNLVRTSALDANRPLAQSSPRQGDPWGSRRPVQVVDSGEPGANRQLTVDVTLILADERDTQARGVNLLDGLQGIFGYSRITQVSEQVGVGSNVTRNITRAIRAPDVTYNLNIFNNRSRWYEAVARPSLTAYLGEQSSFFIGDQINVTVAGIQSAQLERLDVGVSLRITPAEIRPDGARFRVEVDRAFFSDQSSGTFREAISSFKQSVAATADVRFGETLILSGLSESIADGQNSRTPGLSDVPLLEHLFKNTVRVSRKRSAIVLVTPTPPASMARTVDRNSSLQRVIELWDQLIEPRTGAKPQLDRIRSMRLFSRAAADDVVVRDLWDPALRKAFMQAQVAAQWSDPMLRAPARGEAAPSR